MKTFAVLCKEFLRIFLTELMRMGGGKRGSFGSLFDGPLLSLFLNIFLALL